MYQKTPTNKSKISLQIKQQTLTKPISASN